MKKIALLLALVLVASCFALVACNKDEGSSVAESKAEESSEIEESSEVEESSVAESKAEESSADESSEEESSADESSEEESSEDAAKEPVSVEGTNVAQGKTPIGLKVNGDNPAYCADLTDGAASENTDYNDEWFGFLANLDSDKNNTVDGVGEVILDLGSKVENMTVARVHVWPCNTSGINLPETISFSVSDDGKTFTKVGNLTLPGGDAPAWAELSLENVSGRYVKFALTRKGGSGVWMFLNEVEVYSK